VLGWQQSEHIMSTVLSSISRRALALAAEMGSKPVFTNAIGFAVQASEDNKRSPGVVYLAVLSAMGAKALSEAPHPDTDSTESNNPDKYSVAATDGSTIKGSFWNDFADATPFGIEYLREIDWIKNKTTVPQVDNPEKPGEKMDNPYSKLGDPQSRAEKKKWDNRKTLIRGVIKTAKKFHDQVDRIHSLNCVKVTLLTVAGADDTKELADTTMPVKVVDTAPDREGFVRFMSIRECLALRPLDVIGKQGNHWELLMKSAERGTKDKDKKTDDKQQAIAWGVDTVENGLSGLAHWIDNPTNRALLAKKSNDEAFILTLGDIVLALDPLWGQIREKYEALQQKRPPAKKVA